MPTIEDHEPTGRCAWWLYLGAQAQDNLESSPKTLLITAILLYPKLLVKGVLVYAPYLKSFNEKSNSTIFEIVFSLNTPDL